MKKRVDIDAAQPIQSLHQLKALRWEGLTRGAELSFCKPTRGFLQVCCGVIDRSISNPPSETTTSRTAIRYGVHVSKSGQDQTLLRDAPVTGGPLLVLSITADPCGALLSHAGAADPSHSRGLNTLIR